MMSISVIMAMSKIAIAKKLRGAFSFEDRNSSDECVYEVLATKLNPGQNLQEMIVD